ncbi:MAG: Ig-like domain-containing protein [Fimbriimonadaceae bacterium]
MRCRIGFSLVLFVVASFARAQVTDIWESRFDGPGFDEFQQVAIDRQGNVYSAGVTETGAATGTFDLIVQKNDPDSAVLWTHKVTLNSSNLRVTGLVLDSVGNPYVSTAAAASDGDQVRSFKSSDGGLRWARIFPPGNNGGKMALKQVGSTDILYFALSVRNASFGRDFSLKRLSPATGNDVFDRIISGVDQVFVIQIVTDNSANAYALIDFLDILSSSVTAVVAKINNGGTLIWSTTVVSDSFFNPIEHAFGLASLDISNRAVVGIDRTGPSSASKFVSLDRTTGVLTQTFISPNGREGTGQRLVPGHLDSVRALYSNGFGSLNLLGTRLTSRSTESLGYPDDSVSDNFDLAAPSFRRAYTLMTVLGSIKIEGKDDFTDDFQFFLPFQPDGSGGGGRSIAADNAGSLVFCGSNDAVGGGPRFFAFVHKLQPTMASQADFYSISSAGPTTVAAPGLLANDAEHVGSTIVLDTPPSQGSVAISPEGGFVYTPVSGQNLNLPVTFTYKLVRGSSTSAALVTLKPQKLRALSIPRVGGLKVVVSVQHSGLNDLRKEMSFTSNSQLIQVPASEPVYMGENEVEMVGTSLPVTVETTRTVTIRFDGLTLIHPVILTPGLITNLQLLTPELVSDESYRIQCTINGVAGPSGVRLGGSDSTEFIFAPGARTAVVSHSTSVVTAPTTFTFKAGTAEGNTRTIDYVVRPAPKLSSLTLSPTSVIGSLRSIGTVTLNSLPGVLPQTITLSSSSANAKVPATIEVAPGRNSGTFTITTLPVNVATTLTITAKDSSLTTKTAPLTLTRSTLKSITASPSTLTGGAQSVGNVALSNLAPAGGITVDIAYSLRVSGPRTVTIAAGSWSVSFPIFTSQVTSPSAATVTAKFAGATKQVDLFLLP